MSHVSISGQKLARWLAVPAEICRELLGAMLPDSCVVCGTSLDTARAPSAVPPVTSETSRGRGPNPNTRTGARLPPAPALCADCESRLEPLLNTVYCPRCARTARPESIFDDRQCAWCRNEPQWNIAGIARIGPYAPPLSDLLCDLKFGGNQRAAEWLAAHLARELTSRPWFSRVEVLVPVPMHWLRRLQRPCAHARMLAESLGARLGLPVRSWVRRRKYSPSQMELSSRRKRAANVAGCFGPPLWKLGRIRGRRICIVDNLVMSAATLHEVARELRKLGAAEIYAAVACRAAPATAFQAKAEAAQRE